MTTFQNDNNFSEAKQESIVLQSDCHRKLWICLVGGGVERV